MKRNNIITHKFAARKVFHFIISKYECDVKKITNDKTMDHHKMNMKELEHFICDSRNEEYCGDYLRCIHKVRCMIPELHPFSVLML